MDWFAHVAEWQQTGRPIASLTDRCIILWGPEGEVGRLWFEGDDRFRVEGELVELVARYEHMLQALAYYGGLLGAYAEAIFGPAGTSRADDDDDEVRP